MTTRTIQTVAEDLATMSDWCYDLAESGRATKTDYFETLRDMAHRLADHGWFVDEVFAFQIAMRRAVTDTRDEDLARDLFRLHDLLNEWGALTS